MEGLIVLGVIIVIIAVVVIINVINNKNLRITKEYSRLYNAINSLNSRYKFNHIGNSVLKFNPTLKSKRSLDNLNIYQYITNEIENNQSYYSSLFNKIDENIRDYKKYQSEYKSIEKYITKEEFSKFNDVKLKYKTFLSCEKRLYKKLKLKEPTMDLCVECHATYTSPSGRNHYWRDASYSFYQLKQMLKSVEQKQQMALIERERKEKLSQEKRAKEKKLRELDKLEKQLKEKESQINEKQQEFEKATQGHIYFADKEVIQEVVVEPETKSEQKSISERMRDIKYKYDNGEISYEEYKTQRQKLLEEE